MKGRISFASDKIARFELDKSIRAGSHRLQVCRSVARIGALVGVEEMFRDDHAGVGDEDTGPEWCRLFEANPHGKRIDLFDLYIPVITDRRRGCRRGGGIFPV